MSRHDPKTNVEFVTNLMEYSPHGALAQAFIVQAIRSYAEAVAKTTPVDDGKSFINPEAWHGVAVDIIARMDKFYRR